MELTRRRFGNVTPKRICQALAGLANPSTPTKATTRRQMGPHRDLDPVWRQAVRAAKLFEAEMIVVHLSDIVHRDTIDIARLNLGDVDKGDSQIAFELIQRCSLRESGFGSRADDGR